MNPSMQQSIWQQFGAAIDMMENAIKACPPDLWDTPARFWYNAYHAAFFTDYGLSGTPMEADYQPPYPFTKSEFEDDLLPERVYTREEVLAFFEHGRKRLHQLLSSATAADLLEKRFVSEYKNFTVFEWLLYNMRHVQHHAAQLNLLLRQNIDDAPSWVSITKQPL